MKSIFKYICAGAIFFLMPACGDFGDLNQNPNEPTFVGTQTLLTSAQREVASVVGSAEGILYVQQMSEITYTENSRYGAVINDFNGWYSGPLENLEQIIELNSNEDTKGSVLSGGSNNNQIGVARIMKAYYFAHMVERWGPVPLSNALKGAANLAPSYDDEATIFATLFKELKEGAAQLDGGFITGDILLGGDTNEWKKFANTIRANLAMRISDVDDATAKSEFNSAVSGGIFSETFSYNYLGEAANENPWFARFRTRTDYAISNVFVDFLTNTNDPRLNSFADPAASTGTIQGMPYGLENSEYLPTDVSFPNSTYIRAQDSDIPIFSSAQIHFLHSEAAARGWTSGNAEAHYNAAIAASMNQWGITDGDAIAAFIAQDGVKYDASNWKKSIGVQKWVALYTQGYEAWAEWRRLDFPKLQVAEGPLNPSEAIPLRHMYPTSEATLNAENYNAALSKIGGTDTDGARLYWDKF